MHPNRYRCETCKFGKKLILDASNIPRDGRKYPIVYACKKNNDKWMPDGVDGGITWEVGCASHSDLTEWSSQRIIGKFKRKYDDFKDRENIFYECEKTEWSEFYNGWIYGRLCMLKELEMQGNRHID